MSISGIKWVAIVDTRAIASQTIFSQGWNEFGEWKTDAVRAAEICQLVTWKPSKRRLPPFLGAALLIDGGGSNRFGASSRSQSHAIGGVAVLVSAGDDDEFTAQTYSQAYMHEWGNARENLPNLAFFIDLGGVDSYPTH